MCTARPFFSVISAPIRASDNPTERTNAKGQYGAQQRESGHQAPLTLRFCGRVEVEGNVLYIHKDVGAL